MIMRDSAEAVVMEVSFDSRDAVWAAVRDMHFDDVLEILQARAIITFSSYKP